MAEEVRGKVGVVIRRDGTVPFDDDVHPAVKAAIRQHLEDEGHELTELEGGHLKIENWEPPTAA